MRDPRRALRRLLGALLFAIVLASCGSDPAVVTSAGESGGTSAAVPPETGGTDGAEADAPAPVATTPPVEADEPEQADHSDDADPTPPAPNAGEESARDGGGGDLDDSAEEPGASHSEDVALPAPLPDAEPDGAEAIDPETPVTSAPPEPETPVDPNTGWQRIEAMFDLLDPRPARPEELLVGPDGRTVLVRFWNGVEPCSGARATATELPDRVEVLLETGANADAATMSCIALAAAYELAVPLADPLGDRELVAVVPSRPEPPLDDPFDGAEFAVDYYVGLTLDEAQALAAVEGRPFRIGRLDDDYFALTEDFRPSRVTVEVESGIVVAAVGG